MFGSQVPQVLQDLRVQEVMSVQVDNQDCADHQVLMETLEPPVRLELEETQGLLDQPEIREFKDQLVSKVPRALRDPRDALAILDLQDPQGTRGRLAYKAHRVQLDSQDRPDRLVLLDLMDREVIQEQEGSQGQMALLALQGPLGLPGFQEILVQLDLKVHQDNVDQMEQTEILDQRDSVDLLDNQVTLFICLHMVGEWM